MKSRKRASGCPHRHVEVVDPRDGLVAEKEVCLGCRETISIRLLYPPERGLMKLSPEQWPRAG